MRVKFLWSSTFSVFAIGLIGLISGYGIANARAQTHIASVLASIHPIRLQNDKYSLVNPLVAYETPETTTLKEYAALKDATQRIIDDHRDEINRISVYYRNLNTGDWIGINQNDTYYPASLLKVPVMIALFHEAETNPSIMQSRIVYKTISSGDVFDMPSSLVPGTSYSYEDLLKHMITDSDNGATYTLLDHIDQATLDEVYTDLGITKPDPSDTAAYQISTRTYALFFRILYNATYLTPEYSQKALELLARTTYNDGLVAGIPVGTTVVHKYGEHVVSTDRKKVQGLELHDCGIVFHPKQHYLLCVMTQTKTPESAPLILSAISKEVYDSVSAH